MGFFKKIGKGIKKAFKKIGKFVGKIGILGTIALGILTGGMGLGGIFTKFGATLGKLGAAMGGPMGGILKGASWTVGKAAQFGQVVKGGFRTLTKGVTEFLGQTAKYIGNKIPGINIKGAPTDFLGKGGVWDRASTAVSKEFETFKGDIGGLFSTKSPTLEAGKQLAGEEVLKRYNIETPTATPEEFGAKLQESITVGGEQVPKYSPMEIGMPEPTDLSKVGMTGAEPSLGVDVNVPSRFDASGLRTTESLLGDSRLAEGLVPNIPDYTTVGATSTKKSLLGGTWQNIKDTFSPEGITKSVQEIPGEAIKSVGVSTLANKIMPPEEYDAGSSGYVTPFVRQNYVDAESRGLAPMQQPLDDFGVAIVNPVGMDGIYGVEGIYKTRLNNFLDNTRIQGIA